MRGILVSVGIVLVTLFVLSKFAPANVRGMFGVSGGPAA